MERDLELWIEREYSGFGIAVRRKEDPPIEGEPFMSMAIAKDLTRRAVAAFTPPATCTLCSKEPSPGFYTGCMIRDGQVADSEWDCDGQGNLTRKVPPHAA